MFGDVADQGPHTVFKDPKKIKKMSAHGNETKFASLNFKESFDQCMA